MWLCFEKTVSALTYSLLREHCGDCGDGSLFPHNRVVEFILGQHRRMPDYLRMPLTALTLALDASGWIFYRRPFHQLEHAQRWREVQRWQAAPLGALRELINFYQSLAIFGWYAETHEGSPPLDSQRSAIAVAD